MNGTTPGTHLGNTPLNLAKLRELSRKELPEILDKNHGVEKIYHLESDTLETDCPGLIYICRPKLKYMRYIASHIKHFSKSSKIDCWLFFVPERTMICERVLEEEGVKGDITIGSYAMDWIPYEDDLISMELDPSTWKEIYLDGDQTAIYYAARSIMRLQSIYGLFPRIMGKGDAARQLADMLLRMRKEHAVTDQVSTKAPSLLNTVSNHIDQFIIIDRNVDLVTPLCTQLTYEGLIDETMGIKHCVVELDPSLITLAASKGPSTPTTSATPMKKKKYVLNSSDKLFGQLRDQNFAVVGGILNKVAKRINENYEERHNAKTMAQIRDFVGRLDTGIAEEIIANTVTDDFNKVLEVQQNVVAGVDGSREPEYIEEMINRQKPLVQVLRLLCLMSLAQGGLKQKLFDHFEKEIVQTYGYEHIETLHRLEKLGLWMKRTNNKSTFGQCRRLLKLIVDDVDEFHPNDISYVYSGYAPLSIRLVQSAMQKSPNFTTGTSTTSLFSYMGTSTANFVKETTSGWRGAEDILRLLPGQSFDLKQTVEYGPETNAAMARAKRHGLQHGKTTIIFFLGGCTHTEVSAIRFLAQHDEGRDYLVATTQMINGSTFLTPIIQHRNE
ncbi:Sec1-like protein [Rhizopus microsporus var. microsporus]|uniref:Sec1-like protein n=1 Tax=Rhizopus microsporus var. microsporus TaxID=86635 RepID=A0A1X0R218_RHIZD|nr:Sec1-like protein [Rhizopus microsporus var. microsporus]